MSSDKENLAFIRRLKHEIELWLKESLITPEQKERILARYRLVKEAEEHAAPGKLITTVSVLGSVLVGVGVILFVASNWSEIPKWGKLFIIFSSMLTSYALGFFLRHEKGNYPRVGASLILLGSIIYGAGIYLIAQIYHISVHYPNGPLMWGLGVLPLGYLLRLKPLLTLAIVDLLLWLGMESNFRITDISSYSTFIVLVTLYLMAGICLWGLALMHKEIKGLRKISGPFFVFGVLITFASGFFFTFNVFRRDFGSIDLTVFYIALAGMFLISLFARFFLKEKEKGRLIESASLLVLMAAALFLAFFFSKPSSDMRKLCTIVSNIIYAVGIIGLIYLGYIRRYPLYVNIGLVFFVVNLFARYFDFFFRLLPRSLFFIIGGLMLIFGGIMLERKRRKILASFKFEGSG